MFPEIAQRKMQKKADVLENVKYFSRESLYETPEILESIYNISICSKNKHFSRLPSYLTSDFIISANFLGEESRFLPPLEHYAFSNAPEKHFETSFKNSNKNSLLYVT